MMNQMQRTEYNGNKNEIESWEGCCSVVAVAPHNHQQKPRKMSQNAACATSPASIIQRKRPCHATMRERERMPGSSQTATAGVNVSWRMRPSWRENVQQTRTNRQRAACCAAHAATTQTQRGKKPQYGAAKNARAACKNARNKGKYGTCVRWATWLLPTRKVPSRA